MMQSDGDHTMKSKYSRHRIIEARKYWQTFTYAELLEWWKHYTIGDGRGMYNVDENTSFADYIVISAEQGEYERTHNI
jgi:hypothetical protein